MSVPIRFPGSIIERDRNIASHFWVDDEDSGMCNDCGCKPWSVTATWPCGADVPRKEIT